MGTEKARTRVRANAYLGALLGPFWGYMMDNTTHTQNVALVAR